LEKTKLIPADGGILKEVVIGQPQSLNPLLSPLNDADKDLSELLFSGILKYNNEGELIEDLAREYKILNNGKTYEFTLKENLLWSDGEKISADDIIFTIESLQDPKTQSPLRLSWQDIVEKVEKIDDLTIKVTLTDPYPPFIENFTLKILPKHIFKEIKPQEFSSKPREKIIGSGPFKIKSVEEDEEQIIKKIILDRNPNFYGKSPFLDEIEITFVENEVDLLEWKGKATSLAGISARNKDVLADGFKIYSLSLPRYFALFLNQEQKLLARKEIREALVLATPKKEVVDKVLLGEGRIIDSPFLSENQIGGDFKKYKFNLEEAKKKLEEAEWKDKNNDKIRERVIKEGEKAQKLEFTLYTVDQEQLKKVAAIIQDSWQKIGVKLNIEALEPTDLLQNNIKKRKYDILLFGQALNMRADPFPFWHSTQKEYPGLNLSLYQDNKVDEILEKSVKEIDEKKRKELLQSFQKKVTEDIPAIFLYSPNYLYAAKKEIKGVSGKYIIDSSKRFIDIEKWYAFQTRVPN
jgi:peptide/nickel transport system substrate-binding protein